MTKRYVVLQMCSLDPEVFSCIFLDNKHRVLKFDRLLTGTIDGVGVYPREVLKKALQYNVAPGPGKLKALGDVGLAMSSSDAG